MTLEMIAREVVPELNSDSAHILWEHIDQFLFVEPWSQERLRNRVGTALNIK